MPKTTNVHYAFKRVYLVVQKCMRADHVVICAAFKIAFLGMTMPLAKKSLFQNFIRTSAVKLVVCASFKGDAHCGKMRAHTHTS